MPELSPDSEKTRGLLERIAHGDREALNQLLQRYRKGLRKFVAVRLGSDLQARLDPSDVVQEAQLETARRIEEFLRRRPMPFHVWIRKTDPLARRLRRACPPPFRKAPPVRIR